MTTPTGQVLGPAHESAAAQGESAAPRGHDAPAPCILLVEDHADSAEMTALMLRLEGYDVSVAACAREARELAAACRFDAVIGDVGLPDGCGLDLLAVLQEAQLRFGERPLAAVALSGYGMAADRERSLAAGYAAHLLKPVAAEELIAVLRRLLAAG